MNKPVYYTGKLCPVCLSKDTVSLILNTLTPQEDSISWCSCGKVFAESASKQIRKIIFDFKQGDPLFT